MAQRGRKSAAGLAIVPLRREPVSRQVYLPVPPPAHLSEAMQAWWHSVMAKYEFDDHHTLLLQSACEAWDRTQGAREILAREGISFTDRFGQVRQRPENRIESGNRLIFARLLRDLGLDFPKTEKEPRSEISADS